MITVAIPYLHELSQGEELRYAIRSWCKHMRDEFEIVIVGDRPKWYTGNHIQTGSIRNIPFCRAFDITAKLYRIISDTNISDEFIYTYDDVYLVNDCTESDFKLIIALSAIQKGSILPHGSDKWKRMLEASRKLFNEPVVYNYETHLPRMFKKQWLNQILNVYNFKMNALLVSTVYFNEYYDTPDIILEVENDIKAGIYTRTTFPQLELKIKGKKFLNHSETAYNNDMKKLLIRLFPEKCRYEI